MIDQNEGASGKREQHASPFSLHERIKRGQQDVGALLQSAHDHLQTVIDQNPAIGLSAELATLDILDQAHQNNQKLITADIIVDKTTRQDETQDSLLKRRFANFEHYSKSEVPYEPVLDKRGFIATDDPRIVKLGERLDARNWTEEELSEAPLNRLIEILSTHEFEDEMIIKYITQAFQNADPKKLHPSSSTDTKMNLAQAYAAETERMMADPQYALDWFKQSQQRLLKAKRDIYRKVNTVDQRLQKALGPYSNKQWEFLQDRIIVCTVPEFQEYHRALYPQDKADKYADETHGLLTRMRLDRETSALLKLNSYVYMRESNNPSAGIKIVFEPSDTGRAAEHEGIHLVAKQNTRPEELDCTVYNGFRPHYFINGQKQGWKEEDYPYVALDEGAVVLINYLMNYGGDMQKVQQYLQQGRNFESESYRHAAQLTANMVDIIGYEAFATAYVNANPNQWLQTVYSSVGEDSYKKYIQELWEQDRYM